MPATQAASAPESPTEEYPDAAPKETVYPAPPPNRETPPFRLLAGLFDKLILERKPDKRRRLLAVWFEVRRPSIPSKPRIHPPTSSQNWRKDVGYDLYPVLRLMLPHKDRERTMYGLKEKNLAKTYIKLIPLGNKDPDAIRLLNWKRPTEKEVRLVTRLEGNDV
jgi:DNA ligase-4